LHTLETLASTLQEILGSDLVGLYLYGSLTQHAFDPGRSDIDCLAVVRRDPTSAAFARLRRRLARATSTDRWMSRVQMQILLEGRLLRPDRRGALYQFGRLSRSGSDGNPLVWMNVLASGVTLAGPRPATLLPSITRDMVDRALRRELEYLRSEISDPASPWRRLRFYRAYAVLTLCRILYTARSRSVISKPRAAGWALRTLPPRWHGLLRAAIASDRGRTASIALADIARLVAFADERLSAPA
jgi:predicted nucleotidyltransferase